MLLKVKRDINQLEFKIVDFHFVKSNNYFHSLEVVDRVN